MRDEGPEAKEQLDRADLLGSLDHAEEALMPGKAKNTRLRILAL